MTGKFALAAAGLATGTLPIAAVGATRLAAPVSGESALAGQGTLFFLGAIALVALAVVLLPEDRPASP